MNLEDGLTNEVIGTITGNGGLAKKGLGTLALTAANTYTGGTSVESGRVVDQNPHGDYDVLGAASLEFQTSGDKTLSGLVSGAGSLTKGGTGILTLTGASTYTRGAAVSEDRLIDLNPHGDYFTNATLEFAKAVDSAFGGIVDGTGTFVKSGAGTLTLNESIKGNVKTQIAGGTLKVAGSVYGDVTGATGTILQFDERSNSTYAARYSGAGALLKTDRGDLTMTNAPTNTGGVRVSGGALGVRGEGSFGGGLAVDTGARFDNGSNGILTINGTSVNAGEISTTLGATTVFTGLASGAGDFLGRGTVDFRGGYNPGASPASVEFQGNLKLSSILTVELGGTTPGTGYDHLRVDGTAFLSDALHVVYYNGFLGFPGPELRSF